MTCSLPDGRLVCSHAASPNKGLNGTVLQERTNTGRHHAQRKSNEIFKDGKPLVTGAVAHLVGYTLFEAFNYPSSHKLDEKHLVNRTRSRGHMDSSEKAYLRHMLTRDSDLEGWRFRAQKPEPPQTG